MSQIGTGFVRTSSMLSGDLLLSSLRRTQSELLKVQTQLSTGKSVNAPSDAPQSAWLILTLQQQALRREQQQANLTQADGVLANVDTALGEVTSTLREAIQAAASQQALLSDEATRKEMAQVVAGQLSSLIDLANRRYQSVWLFGGDGAITGDGVVSDSGGGGIRYLGTDQNQTLDVGLAQPVEFNSNGVQAFGSVSARVRGEVDFNPGVLEATRLQDLNGALCQGVRRGAVTVMVDESEVTVDLSDAETLCDVAVRVTAAIDSVAPGAGRVTLRSTGLQLSISAGHEIGIAESGGGCTARDLGLEINCQGGPRLVVGSDVDARLTQTTPTMVLSGSVDWASGLRITQGETTKVADFSGCRTVQDMMTVIDQLDMGLRLEINENGTGLDLVSDVSGLDLSIGENGGTTAGDLGLRTLGLETKLADFNFGAGVESLGGEDDFEVGLHDGRSLRVSLSGVTTVGQLLQTIGEAATAAGIGGAEFEAGLATEGNGLVLRDHTVGGNDFEVTALSANGQRSWAAEDLGWGDDNANAGAGDTIGGGDVGMVRVESVFTHLKALQDALLGGDTRGIAFAQSKLEADLDTVLTAQADAGVRSVWLQQVMERSQAVNLAEQTMLSNLQDTDVTAAVTRYSQLMAQLEAALQVGAAAAQMSLLDFLR